LAARAASVSRTVLGVVRLGRLSERRAPTARTTRLRAAATAAVAVVVAARARRRQEAEEATGVCQAVVVVVAARAAMGSRPAQAAMVGAAKCASTRTGEVRDERWAAGLGSRRAYPLHD
jgi:hypothetical protein